MLLGYVLKKNTPYSEIQGPRILLQIYPFLSELVDEGGVISSLTLHTPGVSVKRNYRIASRLNFVI